MKHLKKILPFALIGSVLAGGAYYWHQQSLNQLPVLSIAKHGDGGYTFKMNGEPYLVKGVCYNPIPIGKDYTYNFWADPGKPWIQDGKLMKEMGVNAVRLYRVGENPDDVKAVIDDLYKRNGIRSFVGHYLGFWDWPPANYSSPHFREKMKADVLKMVNTYKNEPGIIGWILGNENNYSFDMNVRPWSNDDLDEIKDDEARREAKARIYYTFVNEIAEEIRKIDQTRPIIMGVGEVKSLNVASEVTPAIDVLGVIAYRGATFGNMFRQIKQAYDKPVLMTEFGADRFNAYTREEDQESQARFVSLQWKDIERNSTVKSDKGNAIGGIIFEWTDEWWKGNENLAHTWSVHDQSAQWSNSSYYYDFEAAGRMNINEEWWGIVALKPRPSELEGGLDQRITTKAYYVMKDLWTKGPRTGYSGERLQTLGTSIPTPKSTLPIPPSVASSQSDLAQKSPGHVLNSQNPNSLASDASKAIGGSVGTDTTQPSPQVSKNLDSLVGNIAATVASNSVNKSQQLQAPQTVTATVPTGSIVSNNPNSLASDVQATALVNSSQPVNAALTNSTAQVVNSANQVVMAPRPADISTNTSGPRYLSPGAFIAPQALNMGEPGQVNVFESSSTNIPGLPLVIKKHSEGGYTLGIGPEASWVRGVSYNPVPIGQDLKSSTFINSEAISQDVKLMNALGANAIKVYAQPNQDMTNLRSAIQSFSKNDIYTFVGHDLGYRSGENINYGDLSTQSKITNEVTSLVQSLKNEKGVLAWIVGDANNNSFDLKERVWVTDELLAIQDPVLREKKQAEIYYKFVNQLASQIKAIDPNRFVILSLGDLKSLPVAAQNTPNIDAIGLKIYQTSQFIPSFNAVKEHYDLPVIVLEYGADSFNMLSREEDQLAQAQYLQSQWRNIEWNSTLRTLRGNVLGGFIHEWTDSWWPANPNIPNSWKIHDKSGQWSNSDYYYDYDPAGHNNVNLEWFGLTGYSTDDPNVASKQIEPKLAYYALQEMWAETCAR